MIVEQWLLEAVRRDLVARGEPVLLASVADSLRRAGVVVGEATTAALADALHDELDGYGPLASLLEHPGLTDVLVNGPEEVWVDAGAGLCRTSVRLAGPQQVRDLAVRLAARAGRRLDDAVPWVDARLPEGNRLHAVLPPLAPNGPVICLRIPARRPFSLEDLVREGTLEDDLAHLVAQLVQRRCSFLVTGGTGSGKTTILATLLGLVGDEERIVLVEDSGELRPEHPHVVRLEARTPNVDGAGGVGLDTLVRQALRMRPDRLVVGEVRGAEVVDLLAALNTGHRGGCGTVHANAAGEVPARLAALGIAAGLPREAVAAQAAAGLDAVIHVVRDRGSGRRRVAEVGVVCQDDRGGLRVRPAVEWDGRSRPRLGPGADELERRLEVSA